MEMYRAVDARSVKSPACVFAPGDGWKRIEEELARTGLCLPFRHRLSWAVADTAKGHRLIGTRDPSGQLLGAMALEVNKSRVMPGQVELRVRRFSEGLRPEAMEPLISEAVRIARRDWRVLRLVIEVFSRGRRSDVREILANHGFIQSMQPRSYRNTLTLDLAGSEETIFGGLHKTARENLKLASRTGLAVRPLTQAEYSGPISQLHHDAMERTGGKASRTDWRSILELSRNHPEHSRIVGVFTQQGHKPEDLTGFAWGCIDGDHGTYAAAGTSRTPGSNLPFSYPLVWDLILWSRREGAQWFDLGGVTQGNSATDPLAGISRFKRYFSRCEEEVGEEWYLEPRPILAGMAAIMRHTVHGLHGKFSAHPHALIPHTPASTYGPTNSPANPEAA